MSKIKHKIKSKKYISVEFVCMNKWKNIYEILVGLFDELLIIIDNFIGYLTVQIVQRLVFNHWD